MALRLRRSIILSSSLLKYCPFSAIPSSSPLPKPSPFPSLASRNANLRFPSHFRIPSLSFRSSSLSSLSRLNESNDGKIPPDAILFEGCDYNHWLITMDFPKDPKPTPEEMVETYVQTLAKVVGSVEEAKKRMYACSTTTYTGFQAVMTEEMSEKFRGLPGVVFILPDSYIDPVNKEYGGDKYINGTIIPRPPPVQYGRQGRYGDRNRNPRYDRPRDPMPVQQGNTSYDRQSSMQGDGRNYGPTGQDGRGYGPQQNYGPTGQDGRGYGPQQNYGPTGQDGRGYGPQQNYGPTGQDGRGYGPQQNYGPSGQDGRGYGRPASRDFNPAMERRDFGQGERRDFGQAGGRDYNAQGERRDSMPVGGQNYPPGGRDSYEGERRDPMPSYQRGYNQGEQRNYIPQEQKDFSQGEWRDHAPPEHREFKGDYRDAGASGNGEYRQGMGSGYKQGYSGPNERQGFSPVEHRDAMQGEQRNFPPVGQTGMEQGRY